MGNSQSWKIVRVPAKMRIMPMFWQCMLSAGVCGNLHVFHMYWRHRSYSKHFLNLAMPCVGFLDHSTSPDAPPRESVELRSYCFWEDLPAQDADMHL